MYIAVSYLSSTPEGTTFVSKMTQTEEDGVIKRAKIRIGAVATVPELVWVTIRNWFPVRNANIVYEKGDIAHLSYGGRVRILFVYPGGKVLVRYAAPDDEWIMGTMCPTGAKFVLDASEFATMTVRYEAHQASVVAEKKAVRQVLHRNYRGKPQKVTEGFWVKAVNISPIRNIDLNIDLWAIYLGAIYDDIAVRYGDSVFVSGGTITSRGAAPDGRTLYEYTTHERARGTKAPSGTLFFVQQTTKPLEIAAPGAPRA